MKKTYLFVLLLIMSEAIFANSHAFSGARSSCSADNFCLVLTMPIQSGFSDESYDVILDIMTILPDGDKMPDRYEITLDAGDNLKVFDAMSFQSMTLSFINVIHSPGNGLSADFPQQFLNCEVTYKMEPGMHYLSIYPTSEGVYACL
jgi:hypothetical protein